MELWFSERQTESLGLSCRVRATLCAERTAYQELAILDTEQYGRMLVLDGMVQTTEVDEFVYHEMIAHVPLMTHPRPRRVAVVGGGDGGTVREVLKHPSVEQVTLVEIDGRVVERCREYLPGISAGLDDPRAEVLIADGTRHVREHPDTYDVVLVDSTEPVGAAIGLFSPEFYADVAKSLRDEGIMVAQSESPFLNAELIRRIFTGVSASFPVARLYLAAVPTYPSGLWSFCLGSKRHDPMLVNAARRQLATRYYTPDVHRAAFSLPRFAEALVNG